MHRIQQMIHHLCRSRCCALDRMGIDFGGGGGICMAKIAGYLGKGNAIGNVCFGPNVDIARDPLGGRNYEMYGEDPELVAQTAAAFVRGMQSAGIAACAKHFLANNQESNRNTTSSNLSKRVMMELYARGFEAAIEDGHVLCIMSAYNAVNGEFTSYSKKLLTDLLRGEPHFDGAIVSDWGAAGQNKEGTLAAGMDLIQPGPNDMTACKQAVQESGFPRKF